jgi:aminoglycoside 3-N-acetyltransferase
LDNSAYIVSIGTDLTHSLTMIHTAEDSNPNWNVKNWYRERKFIIIDGEFRMEKTILERQPHWGVLHFGERKLSHDLQKKGLLRSANIDGILVEVLEAKALVNFLNNKNNTGYPYFWISNKDLEK